MDPRIADYIRENRKRYTREAITKQLVAAGHDPGEIERTWMTLDTPDADDVSGEGFWGRFAVIVIGINVGVFLLVGLLTGMLQNLAGGSSVILVILAVALVIGALIAWGLVAATGPTRLSRTAALVIGTAIPALFALLIGGSCYALIGASMPGFTPPNTGSGTLELSEPFAFSGSGEVICTAAQAAGALFSVYSEDLDPADSRHINLSLDASVPVGDVPAEPGMGAPGLFISVSEDPSQPGGTGYHAGPDAEINVDAAVDGLSGTVEFRGLEGNPLEGAGAPSESPESMSGAFSWTCDQ